MQILLPERTYRRVASELAAIAPKASFVLLHDDGVFTCDGDVIDPMEAPIEIAWSSRDLYILEEQAAIRAFMVAVLKSQSVRWLHSGGAGLDHPVFGMISKKGVRLTNSDSGAIAMAEYVLGCVLDVYQPNATRHQLQNDRQWKASPFREVAGTTWLIVGLGAIGREVAVRATAFGASVIGMRRNPRGDEPVAEMIAPDQLIATLPRADVVVLCATLNDSTRLLVNAEFLLALKSQAVLVNVARGGMLDELALLASLESGRPAVAILDVFETEPLPEDSGLWRHPSVRMTAHCSASGSGTSHRSDAGFLSNLERYVAGEALNMEVGPSEIG